MKAAFYSFLAYILPKEVKYIAMLDWMDQTPVGHLTVQDPNYTLRIEKEVKGYIDTRMREELGMPEKKQVRLMIGEGDGRFEIGMAELETMPDGTVNIEITLTNEKYAQALGIGVKLTGILPATTFPDDLYKFQQYKEEWYEPRNEKGK